MNLGEVAHELAHAWHAFFCGIKTATARCSAALPLQQDPHWRDLIPFHEYFHGDTGRGCGASHQTGWTGLIAQILMGLDEGFMPDSHRKPKN